jgi:acyl carrier protein
MSIVQQPSLEQRLRQVVLGSSAIEDEELNSDSRLLEGIVDSLGVAELFQLVEEEIGRPLRDDEMTRDVFGTISMIAGFVRGEVPV